MLSNTTDAVSEKIRNGQDGIAHSVRYSSVSLRAALLEYQIGATPLIEHELVYKSLDQRLSILQFLVLFSDYFYQPHIPYIFLLVILKSTP